MEGFPDYIQSPILVTGATGMQGQAVINALLGHPEFNKETMKIYGVARNIQKNIVSHQESLYPIKYFKGRFGKGEKMFKQMKDDPPKMMFMITIPGERQREEFWAHDLMVSACNAGVRHIVLSTIDRGKARDCNGGYSGVMDWDYKKRVEDNLMKIVEGRHGYVTYTILRSAWRMDNFLPGKFANRMNATIWKDFSYFRPQCLVAVEDIGAVAAVILMYSKEPEIKNKFVGCCGEYMTFVEANAVLKEQTGREMAVTNHYVARYMISWFIHWEKLKHFLYQETMQMPIFGCQRVIKITRWADWVEGSPYNPENAEFYAEQEELFKDRRDFLDRFQEALVRWHRKGF